MRNLAAAGRSCPFHPFTYIMFRVFGRFDLNSIVDVTILLRCLIFFFFHYPLSKLYVEFLQYISL